MTVATTSSAVDVGVTVTMASSAVDVAVATNTSAVDAVLGHDLVRRGCQRHRALFGLSL